MPTSNNLRKILHLKRVEPLAQVPTTNTAGALTIAPHYSDPNQWVLYSGSANQTFFYQPAEDAWVQGPNASLAGTYNAGACGCWNPNGPTGTASAGSANTITTVLSAVASLAGCAIRIISGTGAGQERTILTNTIGANSVVTVTQAWTTNPDATSVYLIRSGRYYVLSAGTVAAGFFKYYDVATNTWTSLSVSGLPATWGTDGAMTAPCCTIIASGQATAGGASTLTNSNKNWTVNQWTRYQVRIISGTGAGQTRVVASNTATIITVSVAWTVNPDASSNYVIEPNEDDIYLVGNAAVTMYRFSISANTWTTIAPAVARASGTPAAGVSLHCITEDTDTLWTAENSIINGRRIYSFRGGNTSTLDYYDIPSNSWTAAGLTYWPAVATFDSGVGYTYVNGCVYVFRQLDGRVYRFSPSKNRLDGWAYIPIAQSVSNVAGNRAWSTTYQDGNTKIYFNNFILGGSTLPFRIMEIG